jgi:hypothetical protein
MLSGATGIYARGGARLQYRTASDECGMHVAAQPIHNSRPL